MRLGYIKDDLMTPEKEVKQAATDAQSGFTAVINMLCVVLWGVIGAGWDSPGRNMT